MNTKGKPAAKKTNPRVSGILSHPLQAEADKLIAGFSRSGATPALPDQVELQTIMLHVARGFAKDADRLKFFKTMAERYPHDFLVFLLFPWIAHEDFKESTPDERLLQTSIQAAVVAAVQAEKDDLAASRKPASKALLLQYFQSFAPYPVPKVNSWGVKGEKPSPWAEDSKVWAKAALRHVLKSLVASTGKEPYLIKYNELTNVEQAYWSAREERKPEKLDVLPTIRLNALPFAESAILHRMDALAQEHGVNLELVEVPWDKVALALLTNRIDAAFYSPKAIIRQFRHLKHQMDGRIVFRTAKDAMHYRKYYLLQAAASSLLAPKIAYVTNSDHEIVLKEFFSGQSVAGKKSLKKAGLPTTLASAQKLLCPVDNPDEAIAAMVNGSATHCLTGGIHHSYITRYLGSHVLGTNTVTIDEKAFSKRRTDPVLPTRLSFFTVARSSNEAKMRLQRLEAIWAAFVQDWSSLCDGREDSAELSAARNGCLEHVNRNPSRAFVDDWSSLKELIRDHSEFPSQSEGVDLGSIEQVPIP